MRKKRKSMLTDKEEILILKDKVQKFERILSKLLPEKTGDFFICGNSEEKDELGLPNKILICPSYGSDGFAIYTKTTDYSAPGY
jgi:hypothetical protein